MLREDNVPNERLLSLHSIRKQLLDIDFNATSEKYSRITLNTLQFNLSRLIDVVTQEVGDFT